MEINLILLNESTNAGYFTNPLNRIQLIADIPVLHRTQLLEVESLALKRVPVDLAKSGGVWTQQGRNP